MTNELRSWTPEQRCPACKGCGILPSNGISYPRPYMQCGACNGTGERSAPAPREAQPTPPYAQDSPATRNNAGLSATTAQPTPPESRSIQRRKAAQRGEPMPVFKGDSLVPTPPAGEPERFFVGTDCSSHRYIVPWARKAEWDAWTEIDEDDERAWDVPDYATFLDGGTLTFTDWRIE
jgi:hypothetical protein